MQAVRGLALAAEADRARPAVADLTHAADHEAAKLTLLTQLFEKSQIHFKQCFNSPFFSGINDFFQKLLLAEIISLVSQKT